MLRRSFLATAALARGQETFFRSPGKGTAIMAHAYYTRAAGVEMRSIEQRWSKSDLIDVSFVRTSADNGRTWSAPVTEPTGEKRATGTWRKHQRAGFIDPRSKRLIEFWMEAVLPSDDPLEGLRNYSIYYKIDGGPTTQLIARGGDSLHPLPGLELGRNGVMLGDNGSVPITAPNGDVLVPVEMFPAKDGKLFNPGGGYTWSDTAVAHGRWNGPRLEWTLSNIVQGDPARTTRGMVEPTIAFVDSRRVLMIMRGSNDKNPKAPGVKWTSLSTDGGKTFPEPKPWTYDDGSAFFSPSACSRLITHSNGRLYWLGNITPENPRGNRPRFPFVFGEVDKTTGLLRRATMREIDTRRAGEDEILSLSNFYAHEDRESKEIVLYMTRLFAHTDGWLGDAMRYRIRV
ncbi:MAG: exo-alpha-sialidase [Acidobacteria bacterium]|nr:exo-alpha-sialidase [Acidobacteriota bacterium]